MSETTIPAGERLRVVGIQGSPYSRKIRAVLRYRRLPYAWIVRGSPEDAGLPRPKVELLPQLIVRGADGQEAAITDSTPIMRELDRQVPARRVRPDDAVVALLDAILEDFADEWLTKAMFHYRWAFAADIAKARAILPRWGRTDIPDDQAEFGGQVFGDRQIARRAVVGSSEATAPILEDGYRRTLLLLGARLGESRFLLGARPAACDFAFYGQLTQLAGFDPTPSAIALETAPRLIAWVDAVEDLSGLEPTGGDWMGRGSLPPSLRALLAEVGATYVPFLLANAKAVAAKAASVECTIAGRPFSQQPFPYQAKCLAWLREEYAALADADRRDADAALAGTGCEALFA